MRTQTTQSSDAALGLVGLYLNPTVPSDEKRRQLQSLALFAAELAEEIDSAALAEKLAAMWKQHQHHEVQQ